jgi:hypothetical protein
VPPCLSYITSPPNNFTVTASSKCCDALTPSFVPNSHRLCYLLRDDHILSFHFNFLCASSFSIHRSFFSFSVSLSLSLTLFSPCLSYITSPPNNFTVTASSKCCDVLTPSFAPNSHRLCYLLRDDHILSFHFNFLCAGSFSIHRTFFSFSLSLSLTIR